MTFEKIAFTGNRINRQSEKRSDDCVETALQNPYAFFIAIGQGETVSYQRKTIGSTLFLNRESIEALSGDLDQAVLLGDYSQMPVLAVPVPLEKALPDGYSRNGFRDIYINNLFTPDETGALAQAAALLSWHQNNRFCSRCGNKSRMAGGGIKRVCDQCQTEYFPRTDPVAIMLVHYQDKCLLARTPSFPAGRYSCLAGFIEQGETFEAAVRRESMEEMGVKVGPVTYLASQPWPFPHSLMLGAHAQALSDEIKIDHDEMEDGRWFSNYEVRLMMQNHHPGGLHLPPSGAIAHYLIKSWLDK